MTHHFVAYSRRDVQQALAIRKILLAAHSDNVVFDDLRDIQLGNDWWEDIKRAIKNCEKLWLVWSASAKASVWVTKEYDYARQLGKVIVPCPLDDTPLPQSLASKERFSLRSPDVNDRSAVDAQRRFSGRGFSNGRSAKSKKTPSWSALRQMEIKPDAELLDLAIRDLDNLVARFTELTGEDRQELEVRLRELVHRLHAD